VEDLTWKQLLDGYSCTECGRCTAACPAALTGKPLSPKKIIVDMRRRLMEKAPLLTDGAVRGETVAPGAAVPAQLVGDYITEDELWACTTCMACVQECPVQIEHVDAIIDMRRYLVLTESKFPKEMQATFQNLERNFTPGVSVIPPAPIGHKASTFRSFQITGRGSVVLGGLCRRL